MIDETVRLLDLGAVSEAVRSVLGRASTCLAHGDLRNALALAESARVLAERCNDELGVAASMVYAGAALSEMGRLQDAKTVLLESFRMFHREPAWEHRLNEAIALIELGKVTERAAALTLTNCIAHFQQAESLVTEAESQYALAGDDVSAAAIESLRENVNEHISGLVEHLTSITERNTTGWLDARAENDDYVVDFQTRPGGRKEPFGAATGLATRDLSKALEATDGELDVADGTVFRAKDESELQAFERDDHGSVHMRD